MLVEVRGVKYAVERAVIDAAIVGFDVVRDGLGKFEGPLGRRAFLSLTSELVHRAIARTPAPKGPPDEYRTERHIRVVRHLLAKRPRTAKASGA